MYLVVSVITVCPALLFNHVFKNKKQDAFRAIKGRVKSMQRATKERSIQYKRNLKF
jgi:hypothetical protein